MQEDHHNASALFTFSLCTLLPLNTLALDLIVELTPLETFG